MKRMTVFFTLLIATAIPAAQKFMVPYNTATTIYFDLYEIDGVDLRVDAAHASGDITSYVDGGTEAAYGTGFTDEGTSYSLSVTVNGKVGVFHVVDQTATKAWLDETLVVETYGHASAQHPTLGWLTGDPYARLGAPAGASVSADIAAIEGQTDDIGVAGVGLTAVPWNSAWDSEVESEVDDSIGGGTGTALTAVPWNSSWDSELLQDTDLSSPEDIRSEIDANSTQLAAILTDTGTTLPATLTDMSGATFSSSTDSLEAIRNRGDAAWTTGAGGSSPTVEEIRAEIDANSTELAAILTDTGTTIPGTLTTMDGKLDTIDNYIDTEIAAIKAVTDDALSLTTQQETALAYFFDEASPSKTMEDVGGTSALTVEDIRAEIDANSTQLAAILTDTGTTLPATLTTIEGKIDTVDGVADAVLVDTGTTLPATLTDMSGATFSTATDSLEAIRDRGDASWTTGAGGSVNWDDMFTDPNWTAMVAYIDTEVADILADTGTTLPATLTTIEGKVDTVLADSNDIQEDWATMVSNVAAILADTSAYDSDAERAAAILDAVAASYNTAGTIGEKINNGGTGAAGGDTIDVRIGE